MALNYYYGTKYSCADCGTPLEFDVVVAFDSAIVVVINKHYVSNTTGFNYRITGEASFDEFADELNGTPYDSCSIACFGTTTTTSTTTEAPTTTTTSTTTAAPTTTSTTTSPPTSTTTSTTTAAPTTTSTTTAAPTSTTTSTTTAAPTTTSTTTAAPTTTSTTTAAPTTTSTSTTTAAPTTTSTTTAAPTTTSTTTSTTTAAPTTTSTTSTTTSGPILCFTYNGQNDNAEPATLFWTNCNGTSGSQLVDPGAFSDSFCAREGSVSGFNFTINNLGPCGSPTTTTTSTTTAAPTTTSTTTTTTAGPTTTSTTTAAPTTTSTTTAAPTTTSTTSTTTAAPIVCFVYNGQNNNSEPATLFWTNCNGTSGNQIVDPGAFSSNFCAREGSVSGFNFTINIIEPCSPPTTTTTSTTTAAPTTTSTTTAGPTTTTSTTTAGPTTTTSTTTAGPTTTTSTTTGGPTTTTSTTTGGPTTTTSTTTGGPTTTTSTSTTTSTTTIPPSISYTISYSPKESGWTSFHSFYPDWMVTMNNSLYTFKSGNLYKHYSNQTRNSYYGILYPSKITTIFNNEPSQTKQFKTISTNSTTAWDTIVASDQGDGYIENDWYALKEGTWYAYIRRNPDDNNLAMISSQGIGNVTTYSSNVLTFNFNIGDIVSTGDKLYFVSGGNMVFAGVITNHTDNTITINQTGTAPTNGSFILYIKNSVAESTATRGTYLEVQFTNYDTDYTEMYMVSSEVFKSFS